MVLVVSLKQLLAQSLTCSGRVRRREWGGGGGGGHSSVTILAFVLASSGVQPQLCRQYSRAAQSPPDLYLYSGPTTLKHTGTSASA